MSKKKQTEQEKFYGSLNLFLKGAWAVLVWIGVYSIIGIGSELFSFPLSEDALFIFSILITILLFYLPKILKQLE